MTYSITLDPETEMALQNRALTLGISVSDYLTQLAMQAVREQPHLKTGAEILAELEAEGILTGYGDPEKDAPDLARELREQFSRPRHTL